MPPTSILDGIGFVIWVAILFAPAVFIFFYFLYEIVASLAERRPAVARQPVTLGGAPAAPAPPEPARRPPGRAA